MLNLLGLPDSNPISSLSIPFLFQSLERILSAYYMSSSKLSRFIISSNIESTLLSSVLYSSSFVVLPFLAFLTEAFLTSSSSFLFCVFLLRSDYMLVTDYYIFFKLSLLLRFRAILKRPICSSSCSRSLCPWFWGASCGSINGGRKSSFFIETLLNVSLSDSTSLRSKPTVTLFLALDEATFLTTGPLYACDKLAGI